MNVYASIVDSVLTQAHAKGRSVLFEHEVYYILQQYGARVPQHSFLIPGEDLEKRLEKFPRGMKFVLKVVSEHITHKTEAGGVQFSVTLENVAENMERMRQAIPNRYAQWITDNREIATERYSAIAENRAELEEKISGDIRGFLLVEMVDYLSGFGGEFMIGANHDESFGPMVLFGPGGLGGEFFSAALMQEKSVAILPADRQDAETVETSLKPLAVYDVMTGGVRGSGHSVNKDEVIKTLNIFQNITGHFSALNENAKWHIEEIEANPCVFSGGKVVILDGFLRFRRADKTVPDRPRRKIKSLLEPASAGFIGISGSKVTPAGIILKNLLKSGISVDNIRVVHPSEETIQDCKCSSSIDALADDLQGNKLDLFVVGVPASGPQGRTAEDVITAIVDKNIAESILIISAGFDETEGGSETTERLRIVFADARSHTDNGPVASGPNTLGNIFKTIDTRFTPRFKSGAVDRGASNAALICQSGAFMITRLSNTSGALNPVAGVSIGNQLDLTFSDYLAYLKDIDGISVYGVYAEGFRKYDGIDFIKSVRDIAAGGRSVVVYKAGRTEEGKDAAKGHTASIAGNYLVAKHLLTHAGAFVADSFSEFEDMIKLCAMLDGTRINHETGFPTVAALSNAGFEKCSIGDNLYYGSRQMLSLVSYTESTKSRIREIFEQSGLLSIIDIGKILDLTPMATDSVYVEIVNAVLYDDNTECGLISFVPETGMLQTLDVKNENFRAENSVASKLIQIREQSEKPFVVCVESGSLYDPVAAYLEENRVPVFRSVDTAVQRLGRYMQYRIRNKI